MSSLVRAAFQYLEWNDPVSTLKHIRYGKELLSVLVENSLKNNSDKNESFILNLPLIEKALTKNKINLSQATISRCLKLLEQKAFIHLTGSTRSRKCHILHKAWQLYEAEKAYEKKSVKPYTDYRGIDWADPQFPLYPHKDASTVTPETLSSVETPTLKKVRADLDFSSQLGKYKGESAQCAA
jgi:hypothetical protein